jgi:putative NIF3 family GTP cyclohydrolase 1 type 2
MKVSSIRQHFLSRADWIDPANTVDHVIMGDPELDVDRCLVAWMPEMNTLRAAAQRGIKLVICHEPTFWSHPDKPSDNLISRKKVQFIKDNKLVILRNHDCWDRWPKVGIPWAWAEFLGLGGLPNSVNSWQVQHRYDIPPYPWMS